MNTLYTLHLYSPIASVKTLPPLSTLHLTLKLPLSLLFTDFTTCDISHPNSLAAHLCRLIMSANLALHRCFLQCPEHPQLPASGTCCFLSLEGTFSIFPMSKSYPSFKAQLKCSLVHYDFPSQFSFCCLCQFYTMHCFPLGTIVIHGYVSHLLIIYEHLRTESVSNSNLYFSKIFT